MKELLKIFKRLWTQQYKYIIDLARGQDFVSVHKNTKRELGQYPAILTKLAWSIKLMIYYNKLAYSKEYWKKWSSYLFVARRIFLTNQHFCFFLFLFSSIDAFGFPVLWFHEDREITKSLFTWAVERKLSCTCLNFGEILFAGTKRAVPGRQYRSILPARVANRNTEFSAYCPLVELAVQ